MSSRWDLVPHLARLIDGLHDLAGQELDWSDDRWTEQLAGLYMGPYAALRGGLLLDEPGREHVSTEDAIREVLGQS